MSIIVFRGTHKRNPQRKEGNKMKVYAVKVAMADAEWGRYCGEKVIAYTLNKERAEEIRTAEVERIENLPCWWMGYYKKNNAPVVEVEELGEVVE
jgi:hypothetical protein